MKIEIDLSNLMNEYGAFSAADVKAIERATGRKFADVVADAKGSAGSKHGNFTEEQVKNMSDKEYEANRQAILNSLKK
jgi:Na+-transporting NADH:ubiquinone oxidoreductase subunit NqrA